MNNNVSGTMKGRGRIVEMDILRLFLIFLLLVDHSFAPFSGIWQPVNNQQDITAYWYISQYSSSVFLYIFVFISGYLYGVRSEGIDNISYRVELKKKFKRLIVPSVFFSSLYYLLFGDKAASLYEIIYSIICGCGHMWFLPMLFWCFVFVFIVQYYKLPPYIVLPISLLLSLLSFVPLPFRLTQTLAFFFFFYLGYLTNGLDLSRFAKLFNVFILGAIFIVVFNSSLLVNVSVEDEGVLLSHSSRIIIDNVIKCVYVFFGLFALYILSLIISNNISKSIGIWCSKAAKYCFGIYLYQQFILKYLYYYFFDSHYVSIVLIPWLGLLISGIGSVLLTYISFKMPIINKFF